MRTRLAILLALGGCLVMAGAARATAIKTRGTLAVPAGARLLVVSTDPVMQRVLNQDLRLAMRSQPQSNAPVATITVTVSRRALAPGVSLNELAPGDPGVVSLLRAAGASPPPVGASGDRMIDPYATLARRQATMPQNPVALRMHNNLALQRQMFNRSYNPDRRASGPAGLYDTAIIARAAVSGEPGEMTVVAVVHPGEDLRAARELVAEEIANAVLH